MIAPTTTTVNPWTAKITVTAIHPNTHPGNVRAFVTVAIGPLTLHGVKIVQQAGQLAYVRLPETESAGRYFPVLACTDERLKQAISDAVLAAWNGGEA
jgi:DNA-binding cell septation regulator SpoVG